MTGAEIIRRLGRLCGRETMNNLKPPSYPGSPWEYYDENGYAHQWNPMESRDDCAEVEAKLPEDKREYYMELLIGQWRGGTQDIACGRYLIYATPGQRCPALVEATR